MHRQRRPRQVLRQVTPPAILLPLLLGLQRQEPSDLNAHVRGPEPCAPQVGLADARGLPAQHALGRQVGAVLEDLQRDAEGKLQEGDGRFRDRRELFLFGSGNGRRVALRAPDGRRLGQDALSPEVHAYQGPETGHGAGLGQQGGEGVEALGVDEGAGGGGGDGRCGLGVYDHRGGGALGHGAGDDGEPLAQGALEDGAREDTQDGGGELGGVAEEEEDGVDAGGRGQTLIEPGEEGIGGVEGLGQRRWGWLGLLFVDGGDGLEGGGGRGRGDGLPGGKVGDGRDRLCYLVGHYDYCFGVGGGNGWCRDVWLKICRIAMVGMMLLERDG